MKSFQFVKRCEEMLSKMAPYMSSTVGKGRVAFGDMWEESFDETLQYLFSDQARMENAIEGYIRFALEATRLQKRFEKERRYIPKSYQEASETVYHNEEYMLNLYLPGILLSHYLWPHHYRQLSYFHDNFVPRVLASADKSFCDVGVGSGFYSRQLLSASPTSIGIAFDISTYAQSYATQQVSAFGLLNRWQCKLQNVLTQNPEQTWPVVTSVEVLEHLEDPVSFLHQLRRMLRKGGVGFITAALTAPNEDHIYLYNCAEDVLLQLRMVGLEIISYRTERAYQPLNDEPVPQIAAFIVQ